MHAPLTCKSACGPKAVHISGVSCSLIYHNGKTATLSAIGWFSFKCMVYNQNVIVCVLHSSYNIVYIKHSHYL